MLSNERRPLPADGRYACYLRKSREEQRQELLYGGDVLARHQEMMKRTSEVNGHTILQFYREVESGELIAERPAITALIQAVDAGEYDGLYLMAVDRLSRGTDQNTIIDLLESSGLLLVTPSGYLDPWNVQDMDTIRYMLFQAINELRAYARRMNDAIMVGVIGGAYLARLPPFGYDKVKLDNGFKTIRPNDDKELLHKMFEWYAYEGLGYGAIANRLTLMGVPTSTNSPNGWNKATVGGILKNPAYIGVSEWGHSKTEKPFETDTMKKRKVRTKNDKFIQVKGEWPAIVEQELWDAAQERHRSRPQSASCRRDRKLVNPLATLLICAECGRTINYRKSPTAEWWWYRHTNDSRGCRQESSRDDVVIGMLADALREKVAEVDVCVRDGRSIAERERASEAVSNLSALLAKLDRRDTRLIEMLSDDDITREEYALSRESVAKQRSRAQEALADAQAVLKCDLDLSELRMTLTQAIKMLEDGSTDPEDVNRFLKGFISKITYSKPTGADEPTLEVFFSA